MAFPALSIALSALKAATAESARKNAIGNALDGLELSADTNVQDVIKRLNLLPKTIIYKTSSIAAYSAVKAGAEAAAQTGARALKDPIPATFKGGARGSRRGWIYFTADDKKDIERKKGKTEGFVQLQGRASSEQAREEQREAMHRNIFGTVERQGVTPATPFIIKPSKRLEAGIKGVPLKVDRYGNLRNYRKTLTRMLKQDKKYFQVGFNETGRGHRSNGVRLSPGLYMRVLEPRVYKYRPNRVGGGRRTKKKATVNIITLLSYYRFRDYGSKWDYRGETIKAMRKAYTPEFIRRLNIEVEREYKKRGITQVAQL